MYTSCVTAIIQVRRVPVVQVDTVIEMGVAYALNESDPMAVVDRKPVVRCSLGLEKLENNLLILNACV